jgi:hypothetical protein
MDFVLFMGRSFPVASTPIKVMTATRNRSVGAVPRLATKH